MRKLLSALTVPTGLALLIIPAQTQDGPSSPSIGGRDLPQAEVRTPEVAVEATTVQGARLRLG